MFNKIQKLIEENKTIIIVSHIFPDGDAFGSQIALKEALTSTYPEKEIYAVGSGLKEFAHLFGETDIVDDNVFSDALVILLDSNDINRFEDQRCRNAKSKILIDHHLKQKEPFEVDASYQIEGASSTCELVLDLIRNIKLQINEKCANALFLGFLTDTGRFQYVDDFKKVFSDASYLLEKGANPASLFKVLNVVREKDLLVRSIIFSKLKRYKQGLLISFLKYKSNNYCNKKV
jgi:phosphoesterase RecJ-like protein